MWFYFLKWSCLARFSIHDLSYRNTMKQIQCNRYQSFPYGQNCFSKLSIFYTIFILWIFRQKASLRFVLICQWNVSFEIWLRQFGCQGMLILLLMHLFWVCGRSLHRFFRCFAVLWLLTEQVQAQWIQVPQMPFASSCKCLKHKFEKWPEHKAGHYWKSHTLHFQ